MSDDYQRDYDDGFHGRIGDTWSPGYQAGQAAGDRADDAADRRAEIYGEAARSFASNPLKFTINSLIQGIAASIGVGALAGVWSAINSHPPLELAIPAAAVTAAICLVVYLALLAGLLLGVAWVGLVSIVALPFVLWRWLLAFGLAGAAIGYALASSRGDTPAVAQNAALEDALVGLAVGLAAGVLFRVTRGIVRRGRRSPRTAH